MKKPSVVHFTSDHTLSDTRIFHKQCKSLVRAGYAVSLIVPHHHNEIVDGVRVKAIPRPSSRMARVTRTVWQIYREVARHRADVYHFHDPELIPVGLLLRIQGKKTIYDVHENVPKSMLSKDLPGWLRQLLAWLTERAEGLACGGFSALVPATPDIAERFSTINSNTVVVQNFPDLRGATRQTNDAWAQRPNSVAYLGLITLERGFREMVRAMALLPESLHTKLRLAGDFHTQGLRDELAHLPGGERVEVLGYLDKLAVIEVLSQVRAGLAVMHPKPKHHRAWPTKIFEYMLAEIPVIVSDFSLWRKIVEGANCGLLVDPLNPKAIADAIEHIITHPEDAQAMGRRGRQAVEEYYNWGSEERKLLQLYTGLL
jgi:glycosyltransferase involved in cell wall biosynthesis